MNHHFLANVGSSKLEMENKLYIPKLKEAFVDCGKIILSDKLAYTEKALSQLFMEYASCNEPAGKLYDKKEKIIVKKGIVGSVGFDHLRTNKDKFDGGIGYGIGMFINMLYPNKVYKNSFYSELIYRKFGDQTSTLLGVNETHHINSFKFSFIGRSRLQKLPINAYLGMGFTTSLGLNDSVEENGTTSKTKSSVFFAGIVNAGFFVTKNIAIDLRYEIGNGINYVSYKTADNFKTVASGHSSIQASIIVEF